MEENLNRIVQHCWKNKSFIPANSLNLKFEDFNKFFFDNQKNDSFVFNDFSINYNDIEDSYTIYENQYIHELTDIELNSLCDDDFILFYNDVKEKLKNCVKFYDKFYSIDSFIYMNQKFHNTFSFKNNIFDKYHANITISLKPLNSPIYIFFNFFKNKKVEPLISIFFKKDNYSFNINEISEDLFVFLSLNISNHLNIKDKRDLEDLKNIQNIKKIINY